MPLVAFCTFVFIPDCNQASTGYCSARIINPSKLSHIYSNICKRIAILANIWLKVVCILHLLGNTCSYLITYDSWHGRLCLYILCLYSRIDVSSDNRVPAILKMFSLCPVRRLQYIIHAQAPLFRMCILNSYNLNCHFTITEIINCFSYHIVCSLIFLQYTYPFKEF